MTLDMQKIGTKITNFLSSPIGQIVTQIPSSIMTAKDGNFSSGYGTQSRFSTDIPFDYNAFMANRAGSLDGEYTANNYQNLQQYGIYPQTTQQYVSYSTPQSSGISSFIKSALSIIAGFLIGKFISNQIQNAKEPEVNTNDIKDRKIVDDKALASMKKLNDMAGSTDKAAIAAASKEAISNYTAGLKATAKSDIAKYVNKDNDASTVTLEEFTETEIEDFKKANPKEEVTDDMLKLMKLTAESEFGLLDVKTDGDKGQSNGKLDADELAADLYITDKNTDGILSKDEALERSKLGEASDEVQTATITKKLNFIKNTLNQKTEPVKNTKVVDEKAKNPTSTYADATPERIAELKKAAKEEIAKFSNTDNDANTVTQNEYKATKMAEKEKQLGRKLTQDESDKASLEILDDFFIMDTNSDGKVSEDEIAADKYINKTPEQKAEILKKGGNYVGNFLREKQDFIEKKLDKTEKVEKPENTEKIV